MAGARKILILEDDKLTVELLKGVIENNLKGAVIHDCDNVQKAKKVFKSVMPIDVVISDLQLLGVGNGADFFEWLNSRGYEVPVRILASGSDPALCNNKAEGLGVDFVKKPFDMKKILELVNA